ncbi:MAG TPA: hypothetical protein VK518_14830 [Puia sp.]|nr:hypothetical protein [Puia sp.]
MNNSSRKGGFDVDIRSLLKLQHKRVYSVCRLFAHNYKEHQDLFTNIIAAASQNIRARRENSDRQTLIMRACINMAALHSITMDMQPVTERTLQFKSPDYQRSMTKFRESIGDASDYEKFRLFLEFEKMPAEELTHLTGLPLPKVAAGKKKEKEIGLPTARKAFNFIPYLKEKLVWS